MSEPRRILVVDDDTDLRETLCDLLRDEGYEVAGARTGAAALEYLRSDALTPHLILLDLMMPEMTGWEFRREQLADPAMASIPVVVMTANRDSAVGSVTAAEFIFKPISLSRFLEVVATHAA